MLDQVADPRLVAVEAEDHIVADDRPGDHLGHDERVDVASDLATLDSQ